MQLRKSMRALLTTRLSTLTALLALTVGFCGCRGGGNMSPDYDRPFPLGAVTDSHWETQQTNAEAADFVFYDHEFTGDTADLAPGAKRHLEQVALRMEHAPFPIVIEQSAHNANPKLDASRRQTIIDSLARMGLVDVDDRVVVASAFLRRAFTVSKVSKPSYEP